MIGLWLLVGPRDTTILRRYRRPPFEALSRRLENTRLNAKRRPLEPLRDQLAVSRFNADLRSPHLKKTLIVDDDIHG